MFFFIFSRLPTPFVLFFFGGMHYPETKWWMLLLHFAIPPKPAVGAFGSGRALEVVRNWNEWSTCETSRNIEKFRRNTVVFSSEIAKSVALKSLNKFQSTTVISYGQSWWANLQKIIGEERTPSRLERIARPSEVHVQILGWPNKYPKMHVESRGYVSGCAPNSMVYQSLSARAVPICFNTPIHIYKIH